ncbi:MAG: flagellar basal body P-ring protein FlgI [Acidobacteriota bacterium]
MTNYRLSISTAVMACLFGLASSWRAEAAPLDTSQPSPPAHKVFLRDITQIEGVRDNQLVGYGLVVGLNRTGDSQQTFFTVQTLANSLQRMGVQITPGIVMVRDVAAVFVTATLPPFARPGMKVDITASAVGDATSLAGGVLLLTALRASNGQVYAEAQGPLVIGGYSEQMNGNIQAVNHTTVGRIAEGATVERDAAVDLSQFHTLSFLLQNADYTAATDVAKVINQAFAKKVATALDSRCIDVNVAATGMASIPGLIARVQGLEINFQPPARVVINERTGTVVMGGDVRLSAVSIIHGNLSVNVVTVPLVSQPPPFSNGTTTTVNQTTVNITDAPAKSIRLAAGANIDELIRSLHAVGATAHDVIAILEAIKAAGGLQADVEVI